mmetsp:Transcript_4502/g.16666  ORF Transcript_4502/g.16666 Transcript_4502/m.16666 type:complete len:205 (-) Transcript_4502:95-709(-)
MLTAGYGRCLRSAAFADRATAARVELHGTMNGQLSAMGRLLGMVAEHITTWTPGHALSHAGYAHIFVVRLDMRFETLDLGCLLEAGPAVEPAPTRAGLQRGPVPLRPRPLPVLLGPAPPRRQRARRPRTRRARGRRPKPRAAQVLDAVRAGQGGGGARLDARQRQQHAACLEPRLAGACAVHLRRLAKGRPPRHCPPQEAPPEP